MIVLVDTTIWSLALRRRSRKAADELLVGELAELIRELRAVIIGPIRQEILSGISEETQFEHVRKHLAPFDELPIKAEDHEEAARAFNTCRRKGIQGSQIDFLICALSLRYNAPVFTTDKDFLGYSQHLGLSIYQPRTPHD